MANTAIEVGVNNVARLMAGGWVGVNDVAREIDEIWVGDENGKAQLVWSGDADTVYIFTEYTNNSYSNNKAVYTPQGDSFKVSLNVGGTATTGGSVSVGILSQDINIQSGTTINVVFDYECSGSYSTTSTIRCKNSSGTVSVKSFNINTGSNVTANTINFTSKDITALVSKISIDFGTSCGPMTGGNSLITISNMTINGIKCTFK